eukprot:360622-Chlamydomonas_euryale.AAC.21
MIPRPQHEACSSAGMGERRMQRCNGEGASWLAHCTTRSGIRRPAMALVESRLRPAAPPSALPLQHTRTY